VDDELRLKLGIKQGDKVCLFFAPKYLLPHFLQGGLKLCMDWAENDTDVVIYWLRPQDDAVDIISRLTEMIKRSGRIWLILPKKEIAKRQGFSSTWEEIQKAVLESTNLVDTKTLSIGEGEYGTQFVFRKAAREEAEDKAGKKENTERKIEVSNVKRSRFQIRR
jgi:hypothetical protein